MDLKETQKKYPEFIYKKSEWHYENGDFTVNFLFSCQDIEFRPSMVIRGVDVRQIEKIGESSVSNLVFSIGLAEIPTYWKAFCSPVITIEAGYIDNAQKKFWQDLIFNGMGQFFYENKFPFLKPDICIRVPKKQRYKVSRRKFNDRCLVPLGGGKDSLVTLELLRSFGNKEISAYTLNANDHLKNVVAVAGVRNIYIERRIDAGLIELNRAGYFNGHTPFSSLLYFQGVLAAALFDYNCVALSQERSSNEGNIKYCGHNVNHQYSKTFEFENRFQDYSKQYLVKNIKLFSFLRPLYELQITRISAGMPKYFPHFLSCNKSFTIRARQNGNIAKWCGACPKCLFMFAALYSFIGHKQTVEIFDKDLFADEGLIPLAAELAGYGQRKPFECVGTFSEARVAFYLCLRRALIIDEKLPEVLDYFYKKNYAHDPLLKKETAKILSGWNGKNNLSKPFSKILLSSLHSLPSLPEDIIC